MFNSEKRRQYFLSSEEIPEMHENNHSARKMVLGAMMNLVHEVINGELVEGEVERVLEVGCGGNYFYDFLAPEWLKDKLFGFDISSSSLKLGKRDINQPKLFQADVDNLGVAKEGFDAVIGFSSFDSFSDLKGSLKQASKGLKSGKPLLLFQDALVGLHTPLLKEMTVNSVERYHAELVKVVKESPELILEKEGNIESVYVEPKEVLSQRAKGKVFYEKLLEKALLMGDDRGSLITLTRGDTRVENAEILKEFKDRVRTKYKLENLIQEEMVIEWVRLKLLVARKI